MLVQSAVEIISLMDTPILTALEVDAPLIECALNLSTSIEGCFKASNIHLANVLEVTGLCGLTYEINNCVAFCLSELVLSIYSFRCTNGQILTSWSFCASNFLKGFEGLDCFSNFPDQKNQFLSQITNAEKGLVKLNLKIFHDNLLPVMSQT